MTDMTTIWVRVKDRDYLEKLKHKMNKKGIGSVIQSIIELIKFQKSEDELK